MSKRVLVILGHPSTDSFCGALTEHYIEGAKTAGHDARQLQLGTLGFDPVLHEGYKPMSRIEELQKVHAGLTAFEGSLAQAPHTCPLESIA